MGGPTMTDQNGSTTAEVTLKNFQCPRRIDDPAAMFSLDRPSILPARLMQYPGQGELNIWTLLPLDFNHAAINDDFIASYKTRLINCNKQNRLVMLHRLVHSLPPHPLRSHT